MVQQFICYFVDFEFTWTKQKHKNLMEKIEIDFFLLLCFKWQGIAHIHFWHMFISKICTLVYFVWWKGKILLFEEFSFCNWRALSPRRCLQFRALSSSSFLRQHTWIISSVLKVIPNKMKRKYWIRSEICRNQYFIMCLSSLVVVVWMPVLSITWEIRVVRM